MQEKCGLDPTRICSDSALTIQVITRMIFNDLFHLFFLQLALQHCQDDVLHKLKHPEKNKSDVQNKQDLGPETMAFIPASRSPTGKPLLLVAFEVSGTTRLFEVRAVGQLAAS